MSEAVGSYVYGNWSQTVGSLAPRMGNGQAMRDALRNIIDNELSKSGRKLVLAGGTSNEHGAWSQEVTAVPPFTVIADAIEVGTAIAAAWEFFAKHTNVMPDVLTHSDTFIPRSSELA